ncbi:MAG TPA: hypothetical protein VHD57_12135 [Vicinamibacterales bacterium]|jgi:hypothetical protein|nr:hypothetical protein [Vicinamibacterales bacterium]
MLTKSVVNGLCECVKRLSTTDDVGCNKVTVGESANEKYWSAVNAYLSADAYIGAYSRSC